MVYIKRVDLRGFKTFGKKATIHLGRGLTIITGPNGSGKSNILDSVKFALGELSPKEMRGETISDLVHKGPQETSSSRSAYVAVQFDNHDRRIPIDAEAVTISREFRRGGEGIYRLNGKRVSRKQLTDILSSADIEVSSYNIVPQHAINRLADITTEERRKIVEDMVGIAVYDTKKASAQSELQQADLNLKVASAKIDEVRQRVESLERERNDFLKYQQIRKQITQLQAKSVSYKIKKAKDEGSSLEQKIAKLQSALQELKRKRDELLQQKTKLESEKREYEKAVTVEGNARLLEVQGKIGEVSANIASTKAQCSATEATIKSLHKQKTELEQNSSEILQKVATSKKELRDLRATHTRLLKDIEGKQTIVDQSGKTLTELREKLGEHSKEAEGLEQSINSLTNRVAKFTAQIKASATKIDLLQDHLRMIRSRKEEYETLLQSINARLQELSLIKKDEEERALEAEKKANDYVQLRAQRVKEIQHANEVARRAGLALIELETQRTLADNLASEDKALALIEDMTKAGALNGVYGRLGDFVKTKQEYSKAVEAAASGWMKALVVNNIETAVTCVEVLKKNKVGRIKLIPLDDLNPAARLRIPTGVEDVVGPLSDVLKFDSKFTAAVNHVFGDTIITTSQRSAFLASLKGVRSVASTGDLYEPGGGMETGYYRQPFDISKLLLSGQSIDQLRITLSSLEKLAVKAKEEIGRIDREISDVNRSKAHSQGLIESTNKETSTFSENLERARRVIEGSTEQIDNVTHEIGTEQTILETSVFQKDKIQVRLSDHERLRASLRLRSRSATLLEKENEYSALTAELNSLVRQKIEAESRIESLSSAVAVIEPSVEQTRIQMNSIDKQTLRLTADLTQNQASLSTFLEVLKQLELDRDKLSKELAGVNAKRDEYDSEIRRIESAVTKTLDELDPINTESADYTASHKHLLMQIEFHEKELNELGYSETVEVSDEEMLQIEGELPVLKTELSQIGGINELAAKQYEEVKDNYKHLASRIYELEKEKLSIVQFMNELDQKKFDAFMKAFSKVAQSFNEIFSTVTGGAGRLFLENPEKPFEAGADIRLQFRGKTEMTIGAASGGEKSVGTVCFILALQAIHPMPFYMMDEIDAHLDVLNSQKLADLLKEKSRGSQFVVVSLKDVTIARADTVYGVFIQEATSQVVSLPMQEAKMVGRTK